MAYLLFPGRHLLTTAFQQNYLWDILRLPVSKLDLVGDYKGDSNDKITHIIFAVTSANQENSRYNPVPFYMRALGLDRFSKEYRESLGVQCDIVAIPHFNPNEHFADYILKEVSERTESNIKLTNKNTVVLSSTPTMIDMYNKLGFAVLPAEYDVANKLLKSDTPIEYIKKLVEVGNSWSDNQGLVDGVSRSTIQLWKDFPEITAKIVRLWRDPLLTESGSLTETRNYSTYAIGMGHTNLLLSKYKDIKESLVPGKIVDEGCADGALMTLLAKDFTDSDIIGIEITSEFTARCLERQRAGEFGGTFVYFHQRNLMEKIFEDSSIDTTICNSTTHEIWSYGDREESLLNYIDLKQKQLNKGGRLVIRDVVGPENKDSIVYMELNSSDGSNEDILKVCDSQDSLQEHLNGLSTHARFVRFAEDYLRGMRENGKRGEDTKIKYTEEILDNKTYIVLKLKDAMEFMTKKDYTDNWNSELNEEFAFWSFNEWKNALKNAGFRIIENPNEMEKSSRAFAIPWIVENRFNNKVALYNKEGSTLTSIPYPETNMVLIGEKI
ncbi:MAG: methyltransferase domain-containing protein [Patescibacteria group bacterium]